MKTRIRRLGNSLGSTIPAHLIKALGLQEGSQVFVTQNEGKIMITPITRIKPSYSEAELLAGLSAEKAHADEVSTITDDDIPGIDW